MFSKRSAVIELTPANFDMINGVVVHKNLKGKKGMVMFAADWCGHCKRLAPVYEDVADSLGTSFPMYYLDCVRYSNFAGNLGISSFPTVKYINRDCKISKDYNGERTKQAMLSDICREAKTCKKN